MLTLLIFVLMNSILAQSAENTVYIHEWGIIEVDQEFETAVGALPGYLDPEGNLKPLEMMSVEAPVVWFHGAECTGTLNVTAASGFITTAIPWYDVLEEAEYISVDEPGSQTVSWVDLSISSLDGVSEAAERYAPQEEDALEEISIWNGFEYAVPYWRSVSSNIINHPRTGYSDNFLYYECSFSDMTSFAQDMYGYQGTYLLFFMDDSDLTCAKAITAWEMDARWAVLEDDAILETLSLWSGDGLEVSELQALWDTWRPAIRYRCSELQQTVMMFPLSEDLVESICSLNFQPVGEQQVEYSRLFLGLGQI